jgi:DNA-binding response OmpR family regulator
MARKKIMVTTRGEPMNVETGYSSGCNDYVTKPVNTVELLDLLRAQAGLALYCTRLVKKRSEGR